MLAIALVVALFVDVDPAPATTAPSETPPAAAAPSAASAPIVLETDPLPTSAVIDISLLEPSIALSSPFTGATTTLGTTIRPGVLINGTHEIMIGVSMAILFLNGFSSASFTFAPTYRYHFAPVRAFGFSPFVQAEAFVGVSILTATGPSTPDVPFGFAAAFGAEYLFIRNFGLLAMTGLRFVHQGGGMFGGGDTNIISLIATIALSLHF
jgi:hypothetical protein